MTIPDQLAEDLEGFLADITSDVAPGWMAKDAGTLLRHLRHAKLTEQLRASVGEPVCECSVTVEDDPVLAAEANLRAQGHAT